MRAARRLLKLAFAVLRGRTSYDPVEIGGRRLASRRAWEPRWNAIADEIRRYRAESVLDIGCAEAWFLRRAAEDLGCFAIGVDLSERRVAIGEIARLHDSVERLAVMKATLRPEDIVNLPACDVVLCLSVAHHIMKKDGLPAGERFVRAVATLPRKALIFETGGAERWGASSPSPDAFVEGLLLRAGLTNIRVIARTPNPEGRYMRSLFVAEPAAPAAT
jgi:SAM-dependent methyltransferase